MLSEIIKITIGAIAAFKGIATVAGECIKLYRLYNHDKINKNNSGRYRRSIPGSKGSHSADTRMDESGGD